MRYTGEAASLLSFSRICFPLCLYRFVSVSICSIQMLIMLFIVFPHYGVSIGRNDVRSALLQECHLALRTRDTKQQWQKFSWFWNGTFRRKVWWWFQHVDVSIPVGKDESHGPMFPNEFTQPAPGLCACVLMLKFYEISILYQSYYIILYYIILYYILVDHLFAHLRQRSEMVSTSVHMLRT